MSRNDSSNTKALEERISRLENVVLMLRAALASEPKLRIDYASPAFNNPKPTSVHHA
jgi:hypothetical protein